MKSMTELISRESQEKYNMFLSGRAEYGVFEGRDLAGATKGNSAFIAGFADLEGVDIRGFEIDGVRLEDISIPGAEKGKYIYGKRIFKSWREESNLRFPGYQPGALATVLRQGIKNSFRRGCPIKTCHHNIRQISFENVCRIL